MMEGDFAEEESEDDIPLLNARTTLIWRVRRSKRARWESWWPMALRAEKMVISVEATAVTVLSTR